MADPVIHPSNDLPDSEEVRLVSTARSRGQKMYMMPSSVHGMDVRLHKRSRSAYAAIELIHINSEIKADRDFLIQTFPQKVEFPEFGPNSKLEWCIFCLGSKLCARIYKEGYEEPVTEIIGHTPLLSIIVHLDQDALFLLLEHFHEWFLRIGMEESLGEWIYAVLSCVDLPLAEDTSFIIEALSDDCEKRLMLCKDRFERIRLYRISAILDVELLDLLA